MPKIQGIEQVKAKQEIVAIIIRADFQKEGIEFFTPNDFSQQLAYMKRKKGYQIAPHVHNLVPREVIITKEVLFIRKGRVRVDLYDEKKRFLKSVILKTGDTILLASGGHGFEFLAETEMIEVKQGPYLGELDKTHFEATKKIGKGAINDSGQ